MSNSEIKLDDVVQVVRGSEWGVLGVVMQITGPEVLLWGRNPGYLGSETYKLQIPIKHVMLVGRGKVRPLKPNESRVPVPGSEQPKPQPQTQQQAEPEPVKRKPGRPRKLPVAPQPETISPAETRDENEIQAGALAFGMDLEPEDIIPKPKPQEEINPDLLKTAVVRRPSAHDIHSKGP